MNFSYDYPAQQTHVKNWAKKGWGLARMQRKMQQKFPHHGPTILLRGIVMSCAEEGIYFSTNTFNYVMRQQKFEQDEKIAIRNWIHGKEQGDFLGITYATEMVKISSVTRVLASNPTKTPITYLRPLKSQIDHLTANKQVIS